MMTSSNGNIFRVTGHLCGEFTCVRWIPHTKASDAELWYFFDLRLNKRLSKQSWGWWFEMLSCPLWRQCNVDMTYRARHLGRHWCRLITWTNYNYFPIWPSGKHVNNMSINTKIVAIPFYKIRWKYIQKYGYFVNIQDFVHDNRISCARLARDSLRGQFLKITDMTARLGPFITW